MPHTAPTIRASVLAELRDYVARQGQSLDPLLEEAGIDRACLDDPLAAAPLNAVIELFDTAAKVMGDPASACTSPRASGPVAPVSSGTCQ